MLKKKKKKKGGGATSKKKKTKKGGNIGSCPHVPVSARTYFMQNEKKIVCEKSKEIK